VPATTARHTFLLHPPRRLAGLPGREREPHAPTRCWPISGELPRRAPGAASLEPRRRLARRRTDPARRRPVMPAASSGRNLAAKPTGGRRGISMRCSRLVLCRPADRRRVTCAADDVARASGRLDRELRATHRAAALFAELRCASRVAAAAGAAAVSRRDHARAYLSGNRSTSSPRRERRRRRFDTLRGVRRQTGERSMATTIHQEVTLKATRGASIAPS